MVWKAAVPRRLGEQDSPFFVRRAQTLSINTWTAF